MAQRFLILHGLTGSGPEHWQSWLAPRLRERGASVSFPALADPDAPDPRAWEDALASELAELARGEGERVVACHSLGGVLWLRYAGRVRPEHRPDRVLLVAPPCGPTAHPELTRFFPVITDRASVAGAARRTLIVCSDNDPYCPPGAASVYGEPLGIETEVIPGAEHLNSDAGYGPWPHLEAWCRAIRPGVAW